MSEATTDSTAARRGYRLDALVIWIALAALWVVLAFTLRLVLDLAGDGSTRVLLVGAAGLVGVFATAALIAVLLHLRRDGATLYNDSAS